jgi:hypothetical protein
MDHICLIRYVFIKFVFIVFLLKSYKVSFDGEKNLKNEIYVCLFICICFVYIIDILIKDFMMCKFRINKTT